MAQLDASGFFSHSDNQRGTRECGALFARNARETGHKNTTIPRGSSLGHLGGDIPSTKPGQDVMTNQEAHDFLAQEAEDGFCCLGEVPVERAGGWFMGSVLSEVATSVDLGTPELAAAENEEEFRKTGWAIPHYDRRIPLRIRVCCAKLSTPKEWRILPHRVQDVHHQLSFFFSLVKL